MAQMMPDEGLDIILGQIPKDTAKYTTPMNLAPIGSGAGLEDAPAPGQPQRALVQVLGYRAGDGHIMVAMFAIWPWDMVPGAVVPIDLTSAYGVLFDLDLATGEATQVGLLLGELTLSDAGLSPGDPVTGSFTGEVDSWPFQ